MGAANATCATPAGSNPPHNHPLPVLENLMNATNQISDALLDVRKAFRLLHGYNRRIRDIVEVARTAIPEQPFKQETWVSPLTGNKRPVGPWWTWDCTPTFDWTFLFRDEASTEPMKYLVAMGFVADEALEDALDEDGEPDPGALRDADQSRTLVELCLIAAKQPSPDWMKIWDAHWIDRDGTEGRRSYLKRDKDDEDSEFPCYLKRIPLEEFTNENAVVSIVKSFRSEAVAALAK